MNETTSVARPGKWTGRHVVFGMLLFGLTMVAALWLYWEMYTRPFRELQNAINAEFPHSSPRAIGGREKSHKANSPATLRIIVRVEFDPNADVPKSEAMAERLVELAKAHHDVTQYDRVEVHLEQRVPEAETRHWSESRPVAEWGAKG